jgi:hypothetical protein
MPFSRAFTDIITFILQNRKILDETAKQWGAHFETS